MTARVLVVDDDDRIRSCLATALQRAGFAVSIADDGAPAIAMSDSQFELLVVDFNMKSVNGAEVVRHYKQRYGAQIFCVVLSGEDDNVTRAACVDAGADEVMTKPTSVIELRKRLAEAVRMQRAAA